MNKGLRCLRRVPEESFMHSINSKRAVLNLQKKMSVHGATVVLHQKYLDKEGDAVHLYCLAWEEKICHSDFPKDGWEIVDTRGI